MLLGLEMSSPLNRVGCDTDSRRKMDDGNEMEDGGRGEHSISCMGDRTCSCKQRKHWVNQNSSRVYGKAAETRLES